MGLIVFMDQHFKIKERKWVNEDQSYVKSQGQVHTSLLTVYKIENCSLVLMTLYKLPMPLGLNKAIHHETDHSTDGEEGTDSPENLSVFRDLLKSLFIIRAIAELIPESTDNQTDNEKVASPNLINSPSFEIPFEFFL